MGEYQLFTDATADISVDMMAEMPEAMGICRGICGYEDFRDHVGRQGGIRPDACGL